MQQLAPPTPTRKPPRTARRRRAIPVLIVVLLVAAVAVGAWTVVRGDDTPPLSLDARAPAGAANLVGHWVVGPGSEAGYRVREKLASLPASRDAVGRTSQVSGGLTIADTGKDLVVRQGAEFEVDMRTLRSGESRRDRALRTRGLETDRFPTARFRTTLDLPVPDAAVRGEVTQVIAFGALTLHGVTKAVALPMTAQVQDGALVVTATYDVLMGDFKIHPPDILGFVTVDIHGKMEIKARLTKRG